MWYSVVQYSAVQCSTVQYSVVQYSALQCVMRTAPLNVAHELDRMVECTGGTVYSTLIFLRLLRVCDV
jgi:hypothetical protein